VVNRGDEGSVVYASTQPNRSPTNQHTHARAFLHSPPLPSTPSPLPLHSSPLHSPQTNKQTNKQTNTQAAAMQKRTPTPPSRASKLNHLNLQHRFIELSTCCILTNAASGGWINVIRKGMRGIVIGKHTQHTRSRYVE